MSYDLRTLNRFAAISKRQKMIPLVIAFGISLGLGACGSEDSKLKADEQKLLNERTALLQENAQLKQENAQQKAKLDQTGDSSAPATPADVSADSSTSKAPSYADIAGIEGADDVKNLAALGVLEANGGKFAPYEPVLRATYVRWLVETNNKYFADSPENQIHLANAGDTNTFVDLPAANPDFKFIQGMANAGYVVGVDKNHFAPDQPLSREQMIAIKAQVDEGAPIASDPGMRMFIPFSDNAEIDNGYLGAIHEDTSVRTTNNMARVWGSTKIFRPKKSVTRVEAVTSLAKIGALSSRHGAAADVLKIANH